MNSIRDLHAPVKRPYVPPLPIRESAWLEGPPLHITATTVFTDRRIALGMRCKACKRRGLSAKPQHFGRRYRVLCVCPACHATEVL